MGILRGTVEDGADPEGWGRVLVTIAEADEALWAAVVVPLGSFGPQALPAGSEVWVAFEAADAARPVVLGLVRPLVGPEAFTWQREALGDAWDRGHAAGSTDGAGRATPNPYRGDRSRRKKPPLSSREDELWENSE